MDRTSQHFLQVLWSSFEFVVNTVRQSSTLEQVLHPPWVNFVNILIADFMPIDPKSAKMTVKSLNIMHFWDLHL